MPHPRHFLILVTLGLVALLSTCASPTSSSGSDSGSLPTAVAAYTGTPMVYETLILEGSASLKADWYAWTQGTHPSGSMAVIYDDTTSEASFTPDLAGTYEFLLEVGNSSGSATATLRIEVAPRATAATPVVSVKYTGTPAVGFTLTLDGSTTTGATYYLWTVGQAPAGSWASITNSTKAMATFVPDVTGAYTFQLEAFDSTYTKSATASLTVDVAAPPAPTIDAKVTGELLRGNTLTLDGTATLGAKSYAWELVSRPAGSTASISFRTSSTASMTPDLVGTYEIKLTATNSGGSSSKTLTVSVIEGSTLTVTIK